MVRTVYMRLETWELCNAGPKLFLTANPYVHMNSWILSASTSTNRSKAWSHWSRLVTDSLDRLSWNCAPVWLADRVQLYSVDTLTISYLCDSVLEIATRAWPKLESKTEIGSHQRFVLVLFPNESVYKFSLGWLS